MSPLISVVSPLFNYKNFVGDMIESVLRQDYSNWELIIVDDGSVDNPWSVIKPYVSAHKNIKFFKHDYNMGYSCAKNTGIVNSSGEYIAMIDSDDMLTVNSLTSRFCVLSKTKKLWVHGQAFILSGGKKQQDFKRNSLAIKAIKGKIYKHYYKNIHAQSVLVTKGFYKRFGLYDESLRHSSDREMWLRALAFKEYPSYTEDLVCIYRIHDKQMHKSTWKRSTKEQVLKEIDAKILIKVRDGINSTNTKMWE